MTYVISFLQDM